MLLARCLPALEDQVPEQGHPLGVGLRNLPQLDQRGQILPGLPEQAQNAFHQILIKPRGRYANIGRVDCRVPIFHILDCHYITTGNHTNCEHSHGKGKGHKNKASNMTP